MTELLKSRAKGLALSAALSLTASLLYAQQTPPASQPAPKVEKEMTRAQAQELFRSVDQILHFASQDTGLPIHHSIKRRLTTRHAVEAFLLEKMKEDKDTARVERSSIVLKKFGLLPRDFELRPFLLSLLKEQIAGYYDSKTKTVNLLNWIDPEEQKPVLAHELTHALQDQHVDLDTWGDQSLEGTPHDVADDNRHLRRDETDTAREAALEGQAMVTYMDWSLAPMAQSLRTSPDIPLDQDDDKPDPDSPMLSKAPLVIRDSLLFPYRDGLRFEQILLKDHGAQAAFAAVLDRPPSSSFEIMHPQEYEKHTQPALLLLPDLHPLLDADYTPYDLGVMGALDVRMLGQAFGGAGPAADLAAAWDGGVYYAAQRRSASAEEKQTTGSIALLYLSRWKTPEAAGEFATLYAADLKRKYNQLQKTGEADTKMAATPARNSQSTRRFTSEEGPILIQVNNREVFVSEGFPSPLADQLSQSMLSTLNDQASAQLDKPCDYAPMARSGAHWLREGVDGESTNTRHPERGEVSAIALGELTAPLVQFFSARGAMREGLRMTCASCAKALRPAPHPRTAQDSIAQD